MMMKRYTNRHNIIHPAKCLLLFMGLCTLLFACQQDDFNYVSGEEAEDETAVLTYNVSLNGEAQTRAIGDGQSVDQLLVGVFLDDNFIKVHTFENRNAEGQFSVSIPLLRKEEYTLVFWAQNKDNGIYTIGENMQITIDYSKYDGKSLKATETFEVFSAVKTGVTVSSALTDGGTLSLTRPFAQVNVAAAEANILDKVMRAELTLTNLPTVYNPLTGIATGSVEKAFTFTNFSVEEDDNLTTDDASYRYLATVWALPTTTNITVNLYDAAEGGNTVRDEMTFTSIELKPNVRLNIVGNMIQLQTMAAWDGVTFDDPTTSTDDPEGKVEVKCSVTWDQLTNADQTRATGNLLHIDTPAELAWILRYGLPDGYTGIHICQDLDMGEHNWNMLKDGPIQPENLSAGTLISALSANEGEHFTISNITMNGNNATGLFGDTQGLTVKDITFSNIHLANDADAATPVGILAGSVKGNLTMQNVTVDGGSVLAQTTGGLVGKIVRKSEKDRAETLQADFNHCTINATAINGAVAGKFVGEFSGYDYNEVLNFDDCSATGITSITASDFCDDRKSCFVHNVELVEKEHFLGREVYCRGTVNFDGNRFVPKWDGTRTVEPLLANATYDSGVTAGTNKFVVYSPFDLTGVRKKTASPAAIYLRADIDMNGQGSDGKFNVPSNFTQSAYSSTDDNVFDPFNYCTTLDGQKNDTENYCIHNLSIAQIEQERAAFILYASGTTVHKNINFRNCQTVAVHKPVTTDAKAYGAILVSNVDATYTMENVHAYDCKVFALQKVGTLGARISGTSTLKNNSVNNCYVENYECQISERFSSGKKTIGSWTVTVYADFYPYGEVGGMYGFIQGNSTLTGCKVNGTTVHAFGQDDKMATVDGNFLAKLGIAGLGYYKVPGRHVSTLIGNIRATGTVTLTGCTVDVNSKCTKRHDKHNSTYNYIGQAYIVKFVDSEGTVTVDGNKITLADCNKNTKL